MSVSLSTRAQTWDALQRGCDVLVIGGGITGAGVALDAATRGYRVALVDRGDFAGGTSSRSTKLVHGGLRYLPQWQFGLVHEALVERERLRRLAPHLVRALAFVIPLYRATARPLGIAIPTLLRGLTSFGLGAGLRGYDLLGRTDLVHQRLTPVEAERAFPGLRTDDLVAAFLYHDAQTDDVRLTHAVLATARQYGALTLNYARVQLVHPGKPLRIAVRDLATGQETQVTARHAVNAAGVWAEEVAALAGDVPFRVERSKGIHLLLDAPSLTGATALVIPETDDGRLAFAVPWQGRLLLGTTDDAYQGDPDEPTATAAEAAYLLEHLNRYLSTPVSAGRVVGAYAGLRPLVRRGSARSAALSRSHEVVEHPGGLVSIIGGKLTTYRQMAEDTVDALVRRDGVRVGCRTHTLILRGGDGGPQAAEVVREGALRAGLNEDQAAHLYGAYGSDAHAVVDLVAMEPALGEALVPELPVVAAEVVYACQHEQLLHLSDFIFFRSHLAVLDRHHGLTCADTVAGLMARELGWSAEEQQMQITDYRAKVERENAFLQQLRPQ